MVIGTDYIGSYKLPYDHDGPLYTWDHNSVYSISNYIYGLIVFLINNAGNLNMVMCHLVFIDAYTSRSTADDGFKVLNDWCLTQTLEIFQLYRGVKNFMLI